MSKQQLDDAEGDLGDVYNQELQENNTNNNGEGGDVDDANLNDQDNENSQLQQHQQQQGDDQLQSGGGGGGGGQQEGEYTEEDGKRPEEERNDPDFAQNERDRCSVFVQNVEFSCTKEEISEHFKDCGKVKTVTILRDPLTNYSKGSCYIEFENEEAVEIAKGLTDSKLRGRAIKVTAKRTNVHNYYRARNTNTGRTRSYPPRGGRGFQNNFMRQMYRAQFMFSGMYRQPRRGFRPF